VCYSVIIALQYPSETQLKRKGAEDRLNGRQAYTKNMQVLALLNAHEIPVLWAY